MIFDSFGSALSPLASASRSASVSASVAASSNWVRSKPMAVSGSGFSRPKTAMSFIR
ncbi:hypothetical protein [Draconibacterium orientale]|uniref:hypothetical protein n=1 Tax=Draconibacterium orientale TaxID=1168034 RepID=UPI0029C0EAA9|nr:hypothetical protein [Draconibacterium orientale]